MDRDIWIHVGMPKAGSTYLQRALFPYLTDVRYGKSTRALKEEVWKIAVRNALVLDPDRMRERIEKELEEIPEEKVLLSHEGLVGNMFGDFREYPSKVRLLKKVFPYGKILLLTRRQDLLIEAIYKQSLKAGYSVPFKRFVNLKDGSFHGSASIGGQGLNMDVRSPDLERIVRTFKEEFGEDRVLVLPWERVKEDPVSMLRPVWDRMGLATDRIPTPRSLERLNRSYSPLSGKLAFFFNRFFRFPVQNGSGLLPVRPFSDRVKRMKGGIGRRILEGMDRTLDPRFWFEHGLDRVQYRDWELFTHEQRDRVLEIHRPGNERLDEAEGLGLEELGYFPSKRP